MSRRKRGEGSIIHRQDGRYEIRVRLPNGKLKYLYTRDEKEATQVLTTARYDAARNMVPDDSRQTVGRFMTIWLESAKVHLRASSWKRYETLIRCHLMPAFGKMKLAKLTYDDIGPFYARKQKELSKTTLRHIHSLLHQILKEAVRQGKAGFNASEQGKAPRREQREMLPLSEQEAAHFLKVARDHKYYALFALAITTGLREGELLGLRWGDMKDDAKTKQKVLEVRRQVQEVPDLETGKRHAALVELKTKGSRRTIVLSQTVLDALRAHKIPQDKEQLRMGSAWHKHNLMFPDPVGGMLKAQTLRLTFKRLARQAGFPKELRVHDLRHTAATLALARGENPKAVSEMLGHASVAFTLQVYGHVVPGMRQQIADTMDDIFLAAL